MKRLRTSPSTARGLALLVLLVLATVVKPVLLIAGELHGFAHAAASAADHSHHHDHGHADVDAHAVADDAAGGDEPGRDGSAWHSLLHVSHCCANLPAMLPDVVSSGPHWLAQAPPSERPRSVQAGVSWVPLRPPTRG